jgi:hypothetical protein
MFPFTSGSSDVIPCCRKSLRRPETPRWDVRANCWEVIMAISGASSWSSREKCAEQKVDQQSCKSRGRGAKAGSRKCPIETARGSFSDLHQPPSRPRTIGPQLRPATAVSQTSSYQINGMRTRVMESQVWAVPDNWYGWPENINPFRHGSASA